MAPPARATGQATQRRLREATLRLAEEHGITGVTIDQIARRAGVSRRTFFRYFSTKEDAAVGDHVDRRRSFEALLGIPPGDRDAVDHCLQAVMAVLAPVWADPDFFRRRFRTIRHDPVLRDRVRATDAGFERVAAAALRPAFPAGDAELLANVFAAAGMAAVNTVLDRWVDDVDLDGEAALADALGQVRRAIRATAAPTDREPEVAVLVVRTALGPDEVRRRVADAVSGA